MSPVPKAIAEGPAYLATHDYASVVATLARMSSSTRLATIPLWSVPPERVIRALEQTNVQPLLLTGIQPDHRNKLDRILEAAPLMPRRLLLQGSPHVILRPGTVKITSTLGGASFDDFADLPWEAYGAHLLKRYMLKME